MNINQRAHISLKPNLLGRVHIVPFLVTATARLATKVEVAPLGFGPGNRGGSPSSYVIASLVYLICAVGFIAISRHMSNAGALEAFVASCLRKSRGALRAALQSPHKWQSRSQFMCSSVS